MTAFAIISNAIDPVRWADQMILSLSAYGNVPRMAKPADWRDWANVVIAFPALAAVGAPRPERFATWADWVHQFNISLRLLT